MWLQNDGSLIGFTIFYQDQDPKALPAAYPYAISMTGVNPAVQDVELLNPYNGACVRGR